MKVTTVMGPTTLLQLLETAYPGFGETAKVLQKRSDGEMRITISHVDQDPLALASNVYIDRGGITTSTTDGTPIHPGERYAFTDYFLEYISIDADQCFPLYIDIG